jgi:TolB-like protein/Flp pilus assembly protein TadD
MTERARRKLAAIVAADVAGYSRLIGADEEGTLNSLRAHRRDLIDPLIAEHGGRIANTAGDSLLMEFPSIVDAVRCSVAVLEGMDERNRDIDEDRCIRFRVGIHLGDVVAEGEDLLGDGVNVAARIEALSESGGISLSDDAYRQIRDRLDLAWQDAGEHEVKNIARPVHVWRWVQDGSPAAAAPAEADGPLSLPDKPSIAVLPFDNMSGEAEQEYFADGMVEDIITGLSRIKWLFVIARNSTFVYKGQSVDLKNVGQELGVRYILEGSVRKAMDRVRVTGQLIEADTGTHVWADRYDRTLDDVFALQDELTMNVVAAIEPSLRKAEIERVKRKRPDSLDAYDMLLRAIPLVYPAMPEEAEQALPLLESALDLEPEYALAHGFTAWSHEIIFARGGLREENRRGAIAHAHAAINHGRDDAIALSLGGFVVGLVEHDRDAARQAMEAALALSPSCALTYNLGSVVMTFGGDADRAIEWGEQALRLSPVDPMSYAPWLSVTLGHFLRGDFEAAAAAARKTFQANPNWSSAHFVLAATHARLGRLDEARAAAARVLELQPGFTISGLCASFDIHPSLAAPLGEALAEAGLPA